MSIHDTHVVNKSTGSKNNENKNYFSEVNLIYTSSKLIDYSGMVGLYFSSHMQNLVYILLSMSLFCAALQR
jgi:hypothetical protein